MEISIVPTTGMSAQAHDSGNPHTAKYGTQAFLPMIPNAPWPTKHAATASLRIQCSVAAAPSPKTGSTKLPVRWSLRIDLSLSLPSRRRGTDDDITSRPRRLPSAIVLSTCPVLRAGNVPHEKHEATRV
jgi:hypothetical protein